MPNENEGIITPDVIYADFTKLMAMYGGLAIRVKHGLALEILAPVDREVEADDAGDYQWYDVTDLEVLPTSTNLRLV